MRLTFRTIATVDGAPIAETLAEGATPTLADMACTDRLDAWIARRVRNPDPERFTDAEGRWRLAKASPVSFGMTKPQTY